MLSKCRSSGRFVCVFAVCLSLCPSVSASLSACPPGRESHTGWACPAAPVEMHSEKESELNLSVICHSIGDQACGQRGRGPSAGTARRRGGHSPQKALAEGLDLTYWEGRREGRCVCGALGGGAYHCDGGRHRRVQLVWEEPGGRGEGSVWAGGMCGHRREGWGVGRPLGRLFPTNQPTSQPTQKSQNFRRVSTHE